MADTDPETKASRKSPAANSSVAPVFCFIGNGIMILTIAGTIIGGIAWLGSGGLADHSRSGLFLVAGLKLFLTGLILSGLGEALTYLRKIAER